MTKYNKVLHFIIMISSFIIGLMLSIGMIYYLVDKKLNDEIKIFFQKGTVPFLICGMIVFLMIGFFELFLIIKKKRN